MDSRHGFRILVLLVVSGVVGVAQQPPQKPVAPITTINNEIAVYDLAFSPDGSLLATGGFDGSLRMWPLQKGREPWAIRAHANTGQGAHGGATTAVAFHPLEKRIATSGADGAIRLWEVDTGALVSAKRAHEAPATDLVITPSGRDIVAGGLDASLDIWTYARGEKGFQQQIHIEAENLRESGLPSLEIGPVGVTAVDVSPDEKLIAIGGDSGRITIAEYPSLRLVRSLLGHTKGVSRAVFSRDGRQLLTGSYDNSARIWDVATGKELRQFRGYTAAVLCVAYSPDGRLVATGSRDHQVDVWSADTGDRLLSLPPHAAGVFAVAFHPRAAWLVTAGYDGLIKFWDVASLRR